MSFLLKNRLLRIAAFASVVVAAVAAPATAAPGDLDRGFGGDGKVTTDFGGDVSDTARAIAVDSQGRVVVGGTTRAEVPLDPVYSIALARYLPTGELDPSFGDGGLVIAPEDEYSSVNSIVIDPQDRILIGGGVFEDDSLPGGIVARFNEDGSIDTSFGYPSFPGFAFEQGGQASPAVGSVAGIRMRAGSIFSAGSIYHEDLDAYPTPSEIAVSKLDGDGDLDPSYGEDGVARPKQAGRFNRAMAMDLASGGRVVVAGTTGHLGSYYDVSPVIARLLPDGSIDRGFGDGGRVSLFEGSKHAVGVGAIAVERSDKTVVVACTGMLRPKRPGGGRVRVVRLRADGARDRNFSGNGAKTIDFGPNFGCGEAALVAKGSLYVGGYVQSRPRKTESEDYVLAKLDRHGRMVPGFGRRGIVKTDFGGGEDQVHDLAIAPGGRILAAGYGYEAASTDMAVAAYRR
ncbi:MAG: delta-60 repeat domain-containing protein [Solirubrobacterales bacterium]